MMRLYKKLRWQSFIAGTVGYSLYYVCRTSLNVVKKPILESGALDATQLGVIGSALLFAYAIGKFINGFLSDHSNIKRFMAAGLAVSAVANLLVGLLGFANGGGIVGNMVLFVAFAVMWGVNGWSQSMGAPRPSSPSRGGTRSASGAPTTDSSAPATTSANSCRSCSSARSSASSAGNGDS